MSSRHRQSPDLSPDPVAGDSFSVRVSVYRERIEKCLAHWLPDEREPPADLHGAMRYSVLNGGKRIRPLLMYATGEVLGIPADYLDGPATALELVHAFSLVHDDLPAMDDDDLRRGRPTTHKAFGDATAILAGDALQTLAFEILARDEYSCRHRKGQVQLVAILASACGSRGMTGGQAIDLASEGKPLSVAELEKMHTYKTGYLIRAAVLMACHTRPGNDGRTIDLLDRFATNIGLAFQIRDDILDVEGATDVIGKPQGADQARGKATYPAVVGMERARHRADELFDAAMANLDALERNVEPLRWLSEYIVRRDH